MKQKEKKTKKGKLLLKIFCSVLCVILVFVAVAGVVNTVGNKANTEKASSFDAVQKEDKLVPEIDSENGYWTFTTDRDFKVLHLTDVHIGAGFLSHKKDAWRLMPLPPW